MKKSEFRRMINEFPSCKLGGTQELANWRIEYINPSLKYDKKLWYQKSLEYFITIHLRNRQMLIPWVLEFVIYLKNKKKPGKPNIETLQNLLDDLSDYMPPEITAYNSNKKLPAQNMHLSFIPSYLDCSYQETYEPVDPTYYRHLILTINQSHEFRLMVARLFHDFSVDAADSLKPRATDKRRINALKKLLSKNPINCPSLVELGALTLLSSLDIDEATRIFKQVLQYDPQNIDAYFWLATISYYCLHDSEKAKYYLEKALKINPNDARCLSFMHLASWDIAKWPEAPYLVRAINNEPKWLLPRIQLAFVFGFCGEWEKQFDILTKRPKIKISTSTNIIDRYYATYVTGNILDNLPIIKEITR